MVKLCIQVIIRILFCLMLSNATIAEEARQVPGHELETRETFFYSLPPGITRRQILATVGEPDRILDARLQEYARYAVKQGEIELEYDGDILNRATHWFASSGPNMHLYRAYGRPKGDSHGWELTEEEYNQHERLVKDREFVKRDAWPGPPYFERSGSDGYVERLYLLRDGYVGLTGSLVTKYSNDGSSEVLWRLFDHWDEQLAGDGITEDELRRREKLLRQYGQQTDGKSIQELAAQLGEPDGRGGSGVLYYSYSIRDGVANLNMIDGGITLSQPGALQPISFEEWLKREAR